MDIWRFQLNYYPLLFFTPKIRLRVFIDTCERWSDRERSVCGGRNVRVLGESTCVGGGDICRFGS